MATENEETTEQSTEETSEGTPPVETAPAPEANTAPSTETQNVTEEQPGAGPTSRKKVISMPSDEVAKIRREERLKGKKLAQSEFAITAKKLGFASVEEMTEAAKRGKKATPAAQPAKPKPTQAKVEREKQEWEEERKRLLRRSAISEKARRQAQRERDQAVVDSELRVAAIRAGVQDTDYALHLLRRDMKGKTAKDLESFDEEKFFVGLKKSHPSLFAVETRPATTGNGSNPETTSKPPPTAKETTKQTTSNEIVDARKLPRDEYEKRLQSLGVQNPAVGYSH